MNEDVAAILISFEFSFTSVVVNRGLSEGSELISNLLQSVRLGLLRAERRDLDVPAYQRARPP